MATDTMHETVNVLRKSIEGGRSAVLTPDQAQLLFTHVMNGQAALWREEIADMKLSQNASET